MHKNNFDFLRLLFAALVVVHHCYPLSGFSEQDPLFEFTHHTLSYSYLGVRGFFIISGYLIFQSLFRSENIVDYLVKRLLRIYPALIVVLIVSAVACSFVYNGVWLDYFKNKSIWTYVPINLSLIKLQQNISGVFENNPAKYAVNGSLWTIAYEFSMYLFIIPFLFIKKFNTNTKALILLLLLIVLFLGRLFLLPFQDIHVGVISLGQWIHFALLFMSGSFLSVIEIEKSRYKLYILAISILLFFACMSFKDFELIQYVLLPPAIIIAGSMALKGISSIGEQFGDVSYGTYIYGFPIQQLLMYYFKFNVLELLLVSLPLTILFGWLSWHLVEKHALAKKKIVYQKLKRFL